MRRRHVERTLHFHLRKTRNSLVDMFRARMFAICCGYEDADDLDHLRSDPAFKLACGRLPTRAGICVPSRRCRGWRMLRACAT
ncbi:transposase [Bradyrhizobium barranii]